MSNNKKLAFEQTERVYGRPNFDVGGWGSRWHFYHFRITKPYGRRCYYPQTIAGRLNMGTIVICGDSLQQP